MNAITRTRHHFQLLFHVDRASHETMTDEKLAAVKALIADPEKFKHAVVPVGTEEVEYATFLVAIQINAPFPMLVTVPVVAYDHQEADRLASRKAYPGAVQYVKEVTSVPREVYEAFNLLWEGNKA